MKICKTGILVVLLLVTALATVAVPAFATPFFTISTGSRPVSPFYTPIGNTTTSTISGSSSDWRFSSAAPLGVVVTISCTDSKMTGYVPITHTNGNVTSLTIATCRSSIGGRVTVTTTASSARPWFLHMSTVRLGSSEGVLEIPPGGSANIRTDSPRCTITVGPQSIDDSFTNANTSLVVNDTSMAFTLAAGDSFLCPIPGTPATQTGTYTLRPATARDDLRVTATS